MKFKKVLAVTLVAAMTMSMVACGGNETNDAVDNKKETDAIVSDTEGNETGNQEETLSYANIVLGESYTDITTTIHVFNQRTDMAEASYPGKNWEAYIADFNELYPNITVEVETDTNYSEDSLLRLQSGDWGDIMMIPAVDRGNDKRNQIRKYMGI